jgi:hypothetical protein
MLRSQNTAQRSAGVTVAAEPAPIPEMTLGPRGLVTEPPAQSSLKTHPAVTRRVCGRDRSGPASRPMTQHPNEPDFRENLGAEIVDTLREAKMPIEGLHQLRFMFVAKEEKAIQSIVAELEPDGYACVIDSEEDDWFCLAVKTMAIDVPTLDALGRRFLRLAEEKDAEFDGWDRVPTREEILAAGGHIVVGAVHNEDVDLDRFPHAVSLRIAESVQVANRTERYADPLTEVLAEHELGVVVGGASYLTGTGEIAFVRLDLQLANLEHAVTLVRQTMNELGAPVGSTIEFEDDDEEKAIEFGSQQAVTVYLDGRSLSEEVYANTDAGDLADMFTAALSAGSLGEVRDDDWMGGAEVGLYMYGPDAERMFKAIEPALLSYPLGQNARVVIRTGAKGSAEREVRIPRQA